MKQTATSNQTISDIAIQYFGSAEKVTDVISGDITSVDDDLTQKEFEYQVTGNAVQGYFSANQIDIGTKPEKYFNSNDSTLLTDEGYYLLQDNGFKLLI